MATATAILGRKVGMTQVFLDETRVRVPVTVVEAGPCKVLQVKTQETDGYFALQLGFGEAKEKNTSLPLLGHFEKVGATPKRLIREVRLNGAAEEKAGDDVTVSIFQAESLVDVTGTSKGKGFAGVMKRHNFKGQRASHGCSKRHRAPGGLGRTYSTNKGVPKGKKMAGHLGSEQVTIQGLKIIKVDVENNLLLIKGAVPGANGSFVTVQRSIQENVKAAKQKK